MLARTGTASLVAGAFLGTRSPFGAREAAAASVAALSSRSVGTHRKVVLESISSLAYEAVEQVLRDHDLSPELDADKISALAKSRERTKARWAAKTRERIVVGELESALALAWDTTETDEDLRPIDMVIAELQAQGLDGDSLCWATISFESHRHEGLIWKQCNKLAANLPDHTAGDLFGFGWTGLRLALRNFDPSLGFTFSTYAVPKIAGQMRDGVRKEHPLPKRLTTFVRKMNAAEDQLAQTLGRAPTLAELAEDVGESFERVKMLSWLGPAASLEEIVDQSERSEAPFLVDDVDPAEATVANLRTAAVREALLALPHDEAEAVRLLMLEERSWNEARDLTGATRRQLQQRCARGKAALAQSLADWVSVPSA